MFHCNLEEGSDIMFEGTVDRFVKAVGRDLYKPVPSLASSDECRPLGIVLKKKKRFFWQSNKFIVKDFQLKDLLTDSSDLGLTPKERDLVTYNRTSVFSIDGHIGAQLKSLFDVELKGEDKIAIEAKLGVVNTQELDTQELITKLKDRKLNLKHDLVEQMRKDPRLVLCVIVSTAYNIADATLHAKKDWEINDENKANFDVPALAKVVANTAIASTSTTDGASTDTVGKIADLDAGGNMKETYEKTFTLPKDTSLAYQVLELMVTGKGDLELCLVDGVKGGFSNIDQVDAPVPETVVKATSTPKQEIDVVGTELKSILSLENRESFNAALREVMKKPATIVPLRKMIRKHAKATAPKSKYEKGSLGEPVSKNFDVSSQLLKFFGFQNKDGVLIPPTVPSPLLDSGSYLFDALKELDDDVLIALAQVDSTIGPALLDIISQASKKKKEISGSSVEKLYASTNPGQQILILVDIKFSKDGSKLVPPTGISAETDIHASAIVCYCLWGSAK